MTATHLCNDAVGCLSFVSPSVLNLSVSQPSHFFLCNKNSNYLCKGQADDFTVRFAVSEFISFACGFLYLFNN